MRVFWKFLQLYLLLFLVCLTESLYAAPRYYFKQISLENGLSQSSVKCVLVDERGVMWIGTQFGLNRFDREKITVYQEERENPHSLPYNDIVFLEEDAEGNIWVGTSRGLACFERDTQKFMRQEIDGQPMVAACSLLMPEGIYFLGKQGHTVFSGKRALVVFARHRRYGTCVVYPQREYPLHVYRFIQENMGGYL